MADERQITNAAELSPIERAQLRAAGKLYDGRDLEPEARLAATDEDEDETNLAGHCSLGHVFVDGQHRYDVWRYRVDSGTIFHAGTTEVVAEIIQFGLEIRDPAAREHLSAALRDRP
jgi:hypothetical protein